MAKISEEVRIRREVLKEVAAMAFQGKLSEKIGDILYRIVKEDEPRRRCCVYKERAILKQRINLALSQPIESDLDVAAGKALQGNVCALPVMTILPAACDSCITEKFVVTDACRNCLAHSCMANCPRQAISIIQNRSFIDTTKCVGCGMCKNVCPYGAIIEITHPCERGCQMKAIKASMNRIAEIDYAKCSSCGRCKDACPFGAISDRSMIVQTIAVCREKLTYALLDNSFSAQLTRQLTAPEIDEVFKKLGFYEVEEIAGGTEEFPFVMKAAQKIKANNPNAAVVFISANSTAKMETAKYASGIDFALTFEELNCMLAAADREMENIKLKD